MAHLTGPIGLPMCPSGLLFGPTVLIFDSYWVFLFLLAPSELLMGPSGQLLGPIGHPVGPSGLLLGDSYWTAIGS